MSDDYTHGDNLPDPWGDAIEINPTSERERFEKWAMNNIGQASRSGYHGTLGRWIYHHNFMNMCWLCWQAALTGEQHANSRIERRTESQRPRD